MTELIITSPDQLREIIRDEIQRTTHQHPESEKDKLMILEEFRKYLPENPARQTIYGWINNRLVPYEKHGKRLYFRKSAIDRWLSNGRKIS